jgi:single-stranded DNA-binding protein
MTARVVVSGRLLREPESRALKFGRAFATATTATLQANDGDQAQCWEILAFSEPARSELRGLREGDALSVQGALRTETNNAKEVSSGVIAEYVLPLHQLGRQRCEDPEGQDEDDLDHSFIIP